MHSPIFAFRFSDLMEDSVFSVTFWRGMCWCMQIFYVGMAALLSFS